MVKRFFAGAKTFLLKSRRVWYVLKKPSKKEYQQVAKVSALGILLLGIIGFIMMVIMKSLFTI